MASYPMETICQQIIAKIQLLTFHPRKQAKTAIRSAKVIALVSLVATKGKPFAFVWNQGVRRSGCPRADYADKANGVRFAIQQTQMKADAVDSPVAIGR
jgi:hypothetical protein